MKEDLMEVVAILDMSGSMESLTNDTISGFNAYVDELRKLETIVNLTLVVFDDVSRTVWSHMPVKQVPKLTTEIYHPDNGTALTDALGLAITEMKDFIDKLDEDLKPGKVSFFVSTDGEENSSTKFNQKQVKEMIVRQTEEEKWDFIFAGANIDAFATSENYGIQQQNVANIHSNALAQQQVFKAVASKQKKCVSKAMYSKEEAEMDFQQEYNAMPEQKCQVVMMDKDYYRNQNNLQNQINNQEQDQDDILNAQLNVQQQAQQPVQIMPKTQNNQLANINNLIEDDLFNAPDDQIHQRNNNANNLNECDPLTEALNNQTQLQQRDGIFGQNPLSQKQQLNAKHQLNLFDNDFNEPQVQQQQSNQHQQNNQQQMQPDNSQPLKAKPKPNYRNIFDDLDEPVVDQPIVHQQVTNQQKGHVFADDDWLSGEQENQAHKEKEEYQKWAQMDRDFDDFGVVQQKQNNKQLQQQKANQNANQNQIDDFFGENEIINAPQPQNLNNQINDIFGDQQPAQQQNQQQNQQHHNDLFDDFADLDDLDNFEGKTK